MVQCKRVEASQGYGLPGDQGTPGAEILFVLFSFRHNTLKSGRAHISISDFPTFHCWYLDFATHISQFLDLPRADQEVIQAQYLGLPYD